MLLSPVSLALSIKLEKIIAMIRKNRIHSIEEAMQRKYENMVDIHVFYVHQEREGEEDISKKKIRERI